MLALLSGCGNDTSSSKSGGVDVDIADAIAEAESRRSADPDAKGGNTCLLDYSTKYDQLLSEMMVLDLTGFTDETMDIKYSKVFSDPTYHSISYRFENKRIGKHPAMDFETELRDEIELGSIKPMSLNQFKEIYRVITQEQTDLANQSIDDVIEGKSDSEEANEKMAELEQQGVDKETTKGAVNMMKDAFANISKSYVNVDDLGEAATWNTFTNSLNVLQNGVHFELYIEVSNDNEENKNTAIAFAEKILNQCK